ncbi:MAG: 30S ribosomal protein S13 [Methanotrichaceae archaeon]
MTKENEEIKHIVRVLNTNLDGHKSVQMALTDIKGLGQRSARVLVQKAGIDPTETMGLLSDDVISNLNSIVESAYDHLPVWMKNRRNDPLTGKDKHIVGTELMLTRREELNIMRNTRSYTGIRHERGLRVRGQRTRSTGRKGATVGVRRRSLRG